VQSDSKNFTLWVERKWIPYSLHFVHQDVARLYDQAGLGIIWLLLSQTITIGGIALVFSMVFNVDLKDFFPYLAISMLGWTLVSGVIGEGARLYHSAGPILNSFPVPYATFAIRMVLRHFVIFAFGLPIFFVVGLYYGVPMFPAVFVSVFNLALLFALLYPLSNVLGMLGARYRDVAPAMSSIIYLMFLMSPVIYDPSKIPARGRMLLDYNPFYYLLELVRRPFLGDVASLRVYLVVLAMIALAWIASTIFDKRYGRYIVFWV
jgi:ABC-type polysaccharide/polyol phosphate export permease